MGLGGIGEGLIHIIVVAAALRVHAVEPPSKPRRFPSRAF